MSFTKQKVNCDTVKASKGDGNMKVLLGNIAISAIMVVINFAADKLREKLNNQ